MNVENSKCHCLLYSMIVVHVLPFHASQNLPVFNLEWIVMDNNEYWSAHALFPSSLLVQCAKLIYIKPYYCNPNHMIMLIEKDAQNLVWSNPMGGAPDEINWKDFCALSSESKSLCMLATYLLMILCENLFIQRTAADYAVFVLKNKCQLSFFLI